MQAGWLRCPADAAVREAVIGSQSAEPHLEDCSVYHARWWARVYCTANFSVGDFNAVSRLSDPHKPPPGLKLPGWRVTALDHGVRVEEAFIFHSVGQMTISWQGQCPLGLGHLALAVGKDIWGRWGYSRRGAVNRKDTWSCTRTRRRGAGPDQRSAGDGDHWPWRTSACGHSVGPPEALKSMQWLNETVGTGAEAWTVQCWHF